MWQMDFKGDFANGRGRCLPLTVIDDHSRYNLALQACTGIQTGYRCMTCSRSGPACLWPARTLMANSMRSRSRSNPRFWLTTRWAGSIKAEAMAKFGGGKAWVRSRIRAAPGRSGGRAQRIRSKLHRNAVPAEPHQRPARDRHEGPVPSMSPDAHAWGSRNGHGRSVGRRPTAAASVSVRRTRSPFFICGSMA